MGSSFDANDANDANAGNVAGGGGGGTGGWFFADRVDLPFITLLSTGNNFSTQPVNSLLVSLPNYRLRDWAAEWYAWLVIGDLVKTSSWQQIDILPAWVETQPVTNTVIWNTPVNWAQVQIEIGQLATAAQDERADSLGEILSQSNEFASYFLNLMTARPTAYPATTKILTIANLVGTFVAMYYKGFYQRPRPSQICPALLPPIAVPGHASLPSGHSTQAHLMALCINDILAGTPRQSVVADDAWTLADRIARNREIAGFHYPSDTEAGVNLAKGVNPLLNPVLAPGAPKNWYQQALGNAIDEWT